MATQAVLAVEKLAVLHGGGGGGLRIFQGVGFCDGTVAVDGEEREAPADRDERENREHPGNARLRADGFAEFRVADELASGIRVR